MSIKIYQAYYQEDQLPNLDPEFTPFDNTVNPVNNLYELYIYKQVRELAEKAGDEMWGVFSWQWKNKLQGPTAKQILDHVQKSKDAGADVVIFNAYPWDEPEAYNVWEQGEWCHPGIAMLGARILDTMGEDYNLVMQPMDYTTYLAANYFVGNKVFWDGLLAFLDKFVAALDELDHLAWCEQRLRELESHPSTLNILWYSGALTLGVLAGLAGDKVSLGFVAETEKQVSAHLQSHLNVLAAQDEKTQVILRHMQEDEAFHAQTALSAGGVELPEGIKQLMSVVASIMTKTSYHI